MNLNQENEINKKFLNRFTYLINKKLNTFNFHKIDNIYENTQTLLKEHEKQNAKLNNKVSVLENLMIAMNKEMLELKKKNKEIKQVYIRRNYNLAE